MEEVFGNIEFVSSLALSNPTDSDHYITEFQGTIFVDEEEAGIINGTIVEGSKALRNNFPMHYVADATADLEEMMNEVYDYETSTFKHTANEYLCITDAIVIDRITVLPKYAGHGVGLTAIQRTINHWMRGNSSIALLRPSPLQDCISTDKEESNKYQFDRFKIHDESATKKLARHYNKVGFNYIPNSKYMCKAL